MARGDLTEREWAIIGAQLPPERGRKARPAYDNGLFLNGMLYVLRVRRWAQQEVGDAVLETLVGLGLTDDWRHMIDRTVRGHSQAAGAKGGPARRALVEAAAALRARSTPHQTVKVALSDLS